MNHDVVLVVLDERPDGPLSLPRVRAYHRRVPSEDDRPHATVRVVHTENDAVDIVNAWRAEGTGLGQGVGHFVLSRLLGHDSAKVWLDPGDLPAYAAHRMEP